MTFLEWCSRTVLKCVLDYFKDFSWTYCVLEMFINLFLIISTTFLEHNVFLDCSYILLDYLRDMQFFMKIMCSRTVPNFVLDYFKDLSWTQCVLLNSWHLSCDTYTWYLNSNIWTKTMDIIYSVNLALCNNFRERKMIRILFLYHFDNWWCGAGCIICEVKQ